MKYRNYNKVKKSLKCYFFNIQSLIKLFVHLIKNCWYSKFREKFVIVIIFREKESYNNPVDLVFEREAFILIILNSFSSKIFLYYTASGKVRTFVFWKVVKTQTFLISLINFFHDYTDPSWYRRLKFFSLQRPFETCCMILFIEF